MNQRTYAQELTKDYLISLGITDVTPDGLHIFKKGKEASQIRSKSGKKHYLVIGLYDPQRRLAVPKEKRNSSTGQFTLGVHVINYVWNVGNRPAGYVVDHIDNNPLNNDVSNLQLVTPKINVTKEKTNCYTNQIKCNISKPLSFYEEKLNNYEARYEEAKANHDADKCHKLRANIYQTRARIRYYKAHIDEANALKAEAEEKTAKKEANHARAARIKELNDLAGKARLQYLQAQHEYGENHFMTLNAKKEWRAAVAERNEFLEISDKKD